MRSVTVRALTGNRTQDLRLPCVGFTTRTMRAGDLRRERDTHTAAVVGAERGAVRTFTRHPFLPVGGNPPHRRTGERRPACRAGYQVPPLAWERYRADDRGRTGDIDLGKVALCQLSYVRAVPGIYHMPCVERGFGVPRSHRSWLPIALSRLVRAHAPRFRAVDREPATQR